MAVRSARFFKAFLCAALAAALLFVMPAAKAEGLSFGEDGTFTILLLSDVEEEPSVSPYYGSALRALLEEHAPDAAFVLGDTIAGDSPRYRKDPGGSTASCLEGVLAPFGECGVPVFGLVSASDLLTGLGHDALSERMADAGSARTGGSGCFALPVADEQGEVRLVVYGADSAAGGGIGPAAQAELRELFTEYEGIPGILLTHDGTIAASGALSPGGSGVLLGELRTDPSFPPAGADASLLAEESDLFLIATGGDHLNAFLTHADGIDLLAVPSASYRAESARETRGVWLLAFDEEEVPEYRLRFVPFAAYERFGPAGAVRYFFTTWWVGSPRVKLAALMVALPVLAAAAWLLLRGRKPGRRGRNAPEEAPGGDASGTP